ncbi:MAG: ABC transporter ATP-binding protein [Bacillota bacterium]
MALLSVESVVKRFGGVVANDHIDLSIGEGEIVGLIGPNGAGKTTLFNCVAGYLRPDAGTIRFAGRNITGWPPHRTSRAGIARTFQIVKMMESLSVEENVMVGAFSRTDDPEEARMQAREILDLVGLSRARQVYPSQLPLAIQKRVELARALATRPRLLMLDESAAGLSPEEVDVFTQLLRHIHREMRLTLLVIEHVMEFVMGLSDRVVVLASGRTIAEGRPDEITRNVQVIEAYLGEKYARRAGNPGSL